MKTIHIILLLLLLPISAMDSCKLIYEDNEQDKSRIKTAADAYDGIHTMYIEYRVLTQLYGLQGDLVNTGPVLLDQIHTAQETLLHLIAMYHTLPLTISNKLQGFLNEYFQMKQFIGKLMG